MNCKFCGNYVPDGSESCPVCGRRADERPISELLAESSSVRPIAVDEDTNVPHGERAEKKKKLKTSYFFPTLLLVLGVLGWTYILATDLLGDIKTAISALTGGTTVPSGSSEFEIGGNVANQDMAVTGLGLGSIAIAAVLTLFVIISVVMLISRAVNRARLARDE